MSFTRIVPEEQFSIIARGCVISRKQNSRAALAVKSVFQALQPKRAALFKTDSAYEPAKVISTLTFTVPLPFNGNDLTMSCTVLLMVSCGISLAPH